MPILDIITGPLSKILDKIIPDPRARDAAKLELLALQGTQELDTLKTQMAAILADVSPK